MAIRLEQHDLTPEFKSFYARREATHEALAVTVGFVTGVGLYALATGFSVYKAATIPTVTVKRLHQQCGQIHKFTKPAPGYQNASDFWIIASITGGGIIYPLTGFLVGGGLGCATQALGDATLWSTKKLEQEIQDRYQSNGEISWQDVQRLVSKLDQEAASALIAKMNFRQLSAARPVLNRKVFNQAIAHVQRLPHQNWVWFGQLEKRTDYSAIQKELAGKTVQRRRQDPHYEGALDRTCPTQARGASIYLDWIKTSNEDPDITIVVDGQEIPANKGPLKANCGLFYSLFKDTDVGENLVLPGITYDEALPFISLLSGQVTDLNADLCLKLLPTANKLSADRLLGSIQSYILNHRQEFNCYALLEQYQGALNLLRNELEAELLAKKTPVYSWEKDAELIKKCGFSNYQAEFVKAAGAYLQQAQTAANRIRVLKAGKGLFDQVTYQGHVQALLKKPTAQLLRGLFEYGKEHDEYVKDECIDFCRGTVQDVLDHGVWGAGEVPAELVDILDPPPAPSEQW